jgi:thiol-disulfide isomerase/thioredoxin
LAFSKDIRRNGVMKKRLKYLFFMLAALALAVLTSGGSGLAGSSFPKFNSVTLDGRPVTSGIFADKKLTMVNIWATWCPPCVAEMPDLARLGRTMPEGAQLVGIALDVPAKGGKKNKAEEIVKNAGAAFPQILHTDEMNAYTKSVRYIPTTIFVDSNGNIVGDPLVGGHSEQEYRAAAEKALGK